MHSLRSIGVALGVVAGAAVVACSSSVGSPLFHSTGGSSSNGGSGATTSGSGGGTGVHSTGAVTGEGGSLLGIGGQDTSRDDAGACKGDAAAAEKLSLDLYVMVDQSLSMVAPDASGMTRWGAVTSALLQFVQSKDSAGIGVGLQYFGLGIGGISCNAADYAMPEVEIAPLPDNEMALQNSLSIHVPSSVTPTPAALQGAIQHAQDWKKSHPSHVVAVLLVTDGEPDLCGLTPDVANAAMMGLSGTPSVQTFVLGVGIALDALNQVAAAGGTGQAYLVSSNMNVSAAVLDALNKIRSATALPCEFKLPTPDPKKPFDYDKVNVVYTPSGAAQEVVYYTDDPSKCDPSALAWHYDDPKKPTRIELCPETCKAVSMGGGTIGYQLYCPVVSLPIR